METPTADSDDPPHHTAAKAPIEPSDILLDAQVFWPALTVLLGVTGLLLAFPEASLKHMQSVHHYLTHDLGWLFLGAVFFALVWLGWLSASRYGAIRLGPQNAEPAYSDISWFGMLFCAGIGSNLLYFGTTEWFGYYLSPPPTGWGRTRIAARRGLGRRI